MTKTIKQQAEKEAKGLVNQIFSAAGITYSKKEFEAARTAALKCQKNMLKVYKKGFDDGRLLPTGNYKDTTAYKIIVALTQAIYNVKK